MADKNAEFCLGSCMRITACSSQGGRKYMEDRIDIHCQRKPNGDLDYVFLGVYDGHGGADASQFAKDHLRLSIVEQKSFLLNDDENIFKAIKDGFLQTHNEMWKTYENWPKTASGYPSTSGTTASVAIIKNGKVYIGHVGDSAIVIGKKFGKIIDGVMLTDDHKPDDPDELRRIETMGGEVMNKSGVMRVVWTRPTRGHQGPVRRSTSYEKVPFLAVARALGDLWSYNAALDVFVVSPDPDLQLFELERDNVCLILGSDGLWNVLKTYNSVEIVNSHEWRELPEQSSNLEVMQSNHARWLARHALLRWGNLRADNISVIAVLLDTPETMDTEMNGVVAADPHLDIASTLTEYPSAMVRITPRHTQVAKTKPVELVYFGTSDPCDKPAALKMFGPRNGLTSWSYQHRNTAVMYRGPGYCLQGEEQTENWTILETSLDQFVYKNKHQTTTCELKTSISMNGRLDHHYKILMETENCSTSEKNLEVEFSTDVCNNVLAASPKHQQNQTNADGQSTVRIIVTTPKRCSDGINSPSVSVRVEAEEFGMDDGEAKVVGAAEDACLSVYRNKRRSTKITSPSAAYNLRRCSRVTRSSSKASPSKSLPTVLRQHRNRFRRLNFAVATSPMVAKKRLSYPVVASRRKYVLNDVNVDGGHHRYGLRERGQRISDAVFHRNKKRPTGEAKIGQVGSMEDSSEEETSHANDSLSTTFKRLKMFVGAGLGRMRRE